MTRRQRGRAALRRYHGPACWQRARMLDALNRAHVMRRMALALVGPEHAQGRADACREGRIAVRHAVRWREQATRAAMWPWGDEDARAFLAELDEMRRADR